MTDLAAANRFALGDDGSSHPSFVTREPLNKVLHCHPERSEGSVFRGENSSSIAALGTTFDVFRPSLAQTPSAHSTPAA
ncbi:hypothetical protein [Lysobacter fragariae]